MQRTETPSDSLRQHYLVQVLRVLLSPSCDGRPCLSSRSFSQRKTVLSSANRVREPIKENWICFCPQREDGASASLSPPLRHRGTWQNSLHRAL